MKSHILATAALAAMTLAAAPAFAQGLSPTTGYGNLGVGHVDAGSQNFTTLGGRLGARFGNYLGLEAEGSFGVDGDKGSIGGVPYESKLKHALGAYAVGYFPVTPQFDLFARVGYGNTKIKTSTPSAAITADGDSWNYGGGAQYFLTAKDGVRADYTRQSFRHGPGHANVWGLSYVRRF
jgi:outer membrane immunogenic protein